MITFIIFCIVIIIQIFYYSVLFGKFYFFKPIDLPKKKLRVSVVICAKDEAKNLENYLPKIANQNYFKFEIVLVNDGSKDHSLQVMQQFKKEYTSDHLTIEIIDITTEKSKGKKSALSNGILSAKNDYIILTDADCKPVSKEWINEITSDFTKERTIILGYGAYRKIKDSFLNKIIRFETMLTALQYFSYAKSGMAYMGVGRNMAYKKEEFLNTNGFKDHINIISGDDDLFINKISTKNNTTICFTKNSFTVSEPETDLHKWIWQKRRHISTANHYKKIHQFLLGLFYVSQILFWVLPILLLIWNNYTVLTIILILIRFVVWYIAIYKTAKKLDEKDLIRFSPIYEISIIFIQLYIFIRNMISSPKQWQTINE
ncbi:MAG: glycosyl transferase family 2 [Bacteroidetes bacterium]|nr:MAG: glycosyl transferase family 2 [Bacteroidota bacterium]